MTREEKLWSMTAKTLQEVGERAGIKITNSDIKKGKAVIIKKILAAEEMNQKNEKELVKEEPERLKEARKRRNQAEADALNATSETVKKIEKKLVPMPGAEKLTDLKKEVDKSSRKRGALIEYNGKAQNICAWAKELGKSANTLYSRIYILGWDVEKAFTK